MTASDGLLTSSPATISLTIADVNDPPVAKETKPRIVKATTTTSLPVLADDSAGPLEPTDTVTVTSVTAALRGTVSIAAGGKSVVYDPRGCLYGGDTFKYTITDGGGKTASASVLVTVARPGTNGLSKKPITDAPAAAFVTGSTIGSTIPTRLTWCGVTASGTSIRSYRLEQSTNGGSSYGSVLFKKTTAKSSTRSLKPGTAYRWRARSTDKAGRTGSFRTSSVSRLTLTQDTSASVSYPTGTWTASSTTSASGGSERFAAAAGASASITLPSTARAFAIVGPRSKTLGSFDVFVDGTKVATVTEKASVTGTQYRHVLYSRSLASGTHTVKLVAVGNGRVYLDAFLALGS